MKKMDTHGYSWKEEKKIKILNFWPNFFWPVTSVEMIFFVTIGWKFEWFCLIRGMYARFAKEMADSSQLIISLILT